MSTLTDLIAEAICRRADESLHVEGGCHLHQREAAKAAAVVADWLESLEAQRIAEFAILGRTAMSGATFACRALAAEARKGVDQ